VVGMLGSGHGRAGPGGRERHCGRNGSDSDDGTDAGQRPAHGRIVARRGHHRRGTSGAPDGASLGHGSGPTRPAARELARSLEKERARGQSVEVHYSGRAPRLGCALGSRRGRGPGRSWTGSLTARRRRGVTRTGPGGAGQPRGPGARTAPALGEQEYTAARGLGTGHRPASGRGPAGTRTWTGDWIAAAAAPRSWPSGQARLGARRRRHDKVRSSVSQVSGARHQGGVGPRMTGLPRHVH